MRKALIVLGIVVAVLLVLAVVGSQPDPWQEMCAEIADSAGLGAVPDDDRQAWCRARVETFTMLEGEGLLTGEQSAELARWRQLEP